MIDWSSPNDHECNRDYFTQVDGQQLQTTDVALGEQLPAAVNCVVIATV